MEPDIDVATLGEAIQRRREARGWTSYRLSQEAGMSNASLRSLEQGSTKHVGVLIVARLAHALDISTDELLVDIGIGMPDHGDVPSDLERIYSELSPPARRAADQLLRALREMQQAYQRASEIEGPIEEDLKGEGERQQEAAYDHVEGNGGPERKQE